MASSLHQMAATIIERSLTLINNDLKKMLREEGLTHGGNKATLQKRVTDLITGAVAKGDAETLQRLQYRVQHHGEAPPPQAASSSVAPTLAHASPSVPTHYSLASSYPASCTYTPRPHDTHGTPPQTCFFKKSPFFEIRELVLSNFTLNPSPSHRQIVNRDLNFSAMERIASRLKTDKSLRLMLFSAIEQPLAPYTRLDVAFPSQIEVRVNQEEVKANYKGLKNKPGSTRPVDITEFVRTTPHNSRNTIQVSYALTNKVYNLFVYMVKKHSVEELTRGIKLHQLITRQSVVEEMMKNANDPDIEVGSSVMSLKDPISTLRIQTPCRSTMCAHNQCFDAESFLQLQEQAPTWTCPICNKALEYESLAIDQYVEELLYKAQGVDQVTIEPNGNWSLEQDTPPNRNGHAARNDDDDEDLVEVPDYRVRSIKAEAAHTPVLLNTPPLPSRETSTAPRSGQKRKSEVVDLTLSDDEEPMRPAKKVGYSTPNSYSDLSRRPQLPPFEGSTHAAYSRPMPPTHGMRSDYSEPSSTSPSRTSYASYRPPPPASRPTYPGQGATSYSTYIGSSP